MEEFWCFSLGTCCKPAVISFILVQECILASQVETKQYKSVFKAVKPSSWNEWKAGFLIYLDIANFYVPEYIHNIFLKCRTEDQNIDNLWDKKYIFWRKPLTVFLLYHISLWLKRRPFGPISLCWLAKLSPIHFPCSRATRPDRSNFQLLFNLPTHLWDIRGNLSTK